MTDDRDRNKNTVNKTGGIDVPNPEALTNFQTHILGILARGPEYGLGIKDSLEEHYAEDDINHGRLYPNLDDLVERGLVEKGEIDDRTNEYELTEKGLQTIEAHVEILSHGLLWPDFENPNDPAVEEVAD